jgi:hypothetical protein
VKDNYVHFAIHKATRCTKLKSIIGRNYRTVEEEIQERMALGNKAFFANKKTFQSELIAKMAN